MFNSIPVEISSLLPVLASVLDEVDHPFLVADRAGRLLYVNPGARLLLWEEGMRVRRSRAWLARCSARNWKLLCAVSKKAPAASPSCAVAPPVRFRRGCAGCGKWISC